MKAASLLLRPTPGVRDTFYSIDILRGLAAITILIYHYYHFFLVPPGAPPIGRVEDVFLLRVLNWRWIEGHGKSAVPLFWMISGFVFMNIYAGHAAGARTFFVNRLARLYPLHLLTLLIVAGLQLASLRVSGRFLIYDGNTVRDFILHLFFASNWVSQEFSFNAPVWSVSVEVLVYALFWIYTRLFRPCLISVAAAFLAMLLLFLGTDNWVLMCGTYFFAGAGCYALFALLPEERRGAALLAGLVLFLLWVAGLVSGRLDRVPLTFQMIGVFAPVLMVLTLSERMGLHSSYRRFRAVGDITYSTYMWHVPLQMLFLLGVAGGVFPAGVVLTNGFFLGYLLVVILFAYASYRLIERPAQNWVRARLLHTRRPLHAIAAP